ncbi:MAG: uvrY 1 [Verrucomicrobia bacterium]|nr:uvrY 1 [Verrucomicrobiota bacterium]
MATPRIAIVEDEVITSDLLATVCEREFFATVVVRESTGRSGLAAILAAEPDLVLLDISLPDVDGLAVAAEILRRQPRARVIAISALRDPLTMFRVRDLRLHGFVDKREQSVEMLKRAISAVLGGEGYFASVMTTVLEDLRCDPRAFYLVLSEYEQQILSLIGNAYTDEEVAEAVGLKPATAQSRRRDIMNKLNIHSTPKLIRYASEMGFSRLGKYLQK